eukprot:gene1693-1985_t
MVNETTSEGQTALMVAIRGGHLAVARTLIENWGAATHLADHEGNTALSIADGYTPIMIAALYPEHDVEIIKALVRAGAMLYNQVTVNGRECTAADLA